MNELAQLQLKVTELEATINALVFSDRYIFQRKIQILDGRNIELASDTGTMIGTTPTQKMGFFGQTPRVQLPTASFPSTVAGVNLVMQSFGFFEP